MFELRQLNPDQYLRGWLFTDFENDVTAKKFFRYEITNPHSRAVSDLGSNLWVKESDMVIKSDYCLAWKIDARVQLQDGKIYTISNVVADPTEISAQSMRLLKRNPSTSYTLSLKEYVNGFN